MIVRVDSAACSPHFSPAAHEIGPAPLWYHALTLPCAPLLTGYAEEQTAFPPALQLSVLLDGRTVALTEIGALSVSAAPRWVALSSPSDASTDAGSLLVWCSFDDAMLKQVCVPSSVHRPSAPPADLLHSSLQWKAFVGKDAGILRSISTLCNSLKPDPESALIKVRTCLPGGCVGAAQHTLMISRPSCRRSLLLLGGAPRSWACRESWRFPLHRFLSRGYLRCGRAASTCFCRGCGT